MSRATIVQSLKVNQGQFYSIFKTTNAPVVTKSSKSALMFVIAKIVRWKQITAQHDIFLHMKERNSTILRFFLTNININKT